MSEYTLWVEGKPVPKGRPRFANGHAYTPPETRAWEELIALGWKAVYPGMEPLDGPLSVEAHVFLANPNRGDGDNYLKAVLDALNGVAWRDDRQAMKLTVEKHRASEAWPRGVLIVVREGA